MPNFHPEGPYNDDYNPSKNYTQILAVPGRAEQAREFTQLGSMNRDFLARLGDAVFKSGTIITGCDILIGDDTATINKGSIYVDGLVRHVGQQVVNITKVGTELISAKLIKTIVTELEDATLRDPAQGFENYGQPGAHRVKEEVVYVLNDPESPAIYTLVDGELVVNTSEVTENLMTDVLARRTFDENGSYKVVGLELRDRREIRDGKVLISLTEGKAYIEGYEVNKPSSTTIEIDYSRDYRTVLNEPKRYLTVNSTYNLNNYPVKLINNLRCVVAVTETVTRGNITGGMDYLQKTPVVDIISVTQGATTYTKGVDFQLTSDSVDWSLNGKDPAIGTTYTVVYHYNRSMVLNTDYRLLRDDDNLLSKVEFLSGGTKPVNDTNFDIDYDFYLARKDLICLPKSGMPIVLKGKSDILRLVDSPINTDSNNLIIGTVLVMPDSSKLTLVNYNTTRLSQSDLYNMYRRIEDIEYNQAMTDLDKEAAAGESPTSLKGVYTDGFVGITKADVTHPEFDCTIDLDLNELTLPVLQTVSDTKPNMNTLETNVAVIGRVVSAPYTHELVLSQPYTTGTMLVNPYAVFHPMCPIKLVPEIDNWIDSSTIVVEDKVTKTTTLRRWWYHRGEKWAEEERRKWLELGFTDGGASLGYSQGTLTNSSTTSEVLLDEAILFMRQRDVEVTGTNFPPNENNITCKFNDTLVPLTPLSGTASGSVQGTVKADSKGRFSAKFRVLPNTPCGSVEVKLSGSNSSGSATYKAQGRKKVIQDTVLTTTTVVNPVDPLAQSFSFTKDTVLTKVGLYFSAKDSTRSVVVQVRNMVNGYPGTISYDEVTVNPENINISTNGTVKTEVVFSKPVYCKENEQYCICILSDSNEYAMHVATLGKQILGSPNYVTSQPYNAGVLFSSSNALTWTAHQTDDLKFDLYAAKYTGNGQVVFDDVSTSIVSRLVLAADYVDYKNAGIFWYYKYNNTAWAPIESFTERELASTTTKLSLKAELVVKYSSSPILATDSISLVGFIEKSVGTYVSKLVTMSDDYTDIRIVLDATLPSGTSLELYYNPTPHPTDNWERVNTPPMITPLSQEFSKYEWNVSGVYSKDYRIKVVLSSNNPLIRPRVRKLMSILKY